MKKKSSRPPSRKESSKKISKKVEEIPPEPIEEPKPKDFNNLEFVQNCLNISKPEELSKFIATEMFLSDYLVNLRTSIQIDFYIYHLSFAKEHSFNVEKTSVFLILMESLMQKLKENDVTLEKISAFFKERLLELSTFKKRQVRIETPTEEIQNDTKKDSKKDSKKNSKTTQKSKDSKKSKEKKTSPTPPVETPAEPEVREEIIPPVFTVEDVSNITDYVVKGLFTHFKLYKYVFNQIQEREWHNYELFTEEPADPYPLKNAMDEEKYIEMKEEERKKREEEERIQREKEEAERKRKEEEEAERRRLEEEERNAPKLSSKELEEIAIYMKYHLNKELDAKIEEINAKLQKNSKNSKPKTPKTPKSGKKK